MNSTIYLGEVSHRRSHPVEHRFRYPVCLYAFDVDELPEIDRSLTLFGYNRIRPVSIHDRDYLTPGPRSIREKLADVLREQGCAGEPAQVILVTAARYLNYVFNPVSFFYCFGGDGALQSVIAHVNNTFGESHLYPLCPSPAGGFPARFVAKKEFHVSPFFDVAGEYEFSFEDIRQTLDISITYKRDERPVFWTRLAGRPEPLNGRTLLSMILRHPIMPLLTVPRILVQAAVLYGRKRLEVHGKPHPSSPLTVRVPAPSLRTRTALALLDRALARIRAGTLLVRLPDRSERTYAGGDAGPRAEIDVRAWRFLPRALRGGDVGFGESYADGDWDSPDVVSLISLLARNLDAVDDRSLPVSPVRIIGERLRHWMRRNSPSRSRTNILSHYDLSNDFFQLFLDSTMTYSCGLFDAGSGDLEAAQRAKLRRMIEKARIGPNHHVLEIGFGWGSFAIEAARTTGCRVTGVTLSEEQLKLARDRVAAAGLADRITLSICDYRMLSGEYDRIVSIEMLEAVGHENFARFFEACDRVLKPGGQVAIQSITIPDERYERYRRGTDWIRKHIFPGGHLPSEGALREALRKQGRFEMADVDHIGPHYARTLREWRRRLLENREAILKLGFDKRFIRCWDYYFSYCEAGFAGGTIDNVQFALKRPENAG